MYLLKKMNGGNGIERDQREACVSMGKRQGTRKEGVVKSKR